MFTDSTAAALGAFVLLTFALGEAYQFDWSHKITVIDGITTPVKLAQFSPSWKVGRPIRGADPK